MRIIAGNILGLALFASSLGAFYVHQRDKAATRPASEDKVTEYRVDYARQKAKAMHRFLIIEFGAGWCEDCRAFQRDLEGPAIRQYFQDHFDFLMVDIGHSDRNFEAAESLGVDLDHGIPAVVCFAPDGTRIGATNKGELEPSRSYRPEQILAFLKAVVDDRTIVNPGASQ